MATRKIVPRADNEGGLGTSLKRWASAFINALTADSATIGTLAGIVKAAAGVLSATALGAANLKFFMNAGGTTPEWASGFFLVSATRDMTAASGDVSYTGVGFKPFALIVMATINDLPDVFSFTFVTAALTRGFGQVGTVPVMVATGNAIMLQTSAGVYQTAVINTLDSDGFTLTWTKLGSPTGTGYVYVLCLR